MGITSKFKRAPLAQIIIDRPARQRENLELEADGLVDSIKRLGVLNPIIVELLPAASDDAEPSYKLLAGERRYTCSIQAGLKDIPIRLASDLSLFERELIELDENVRRRQLHWRDEVRAVCRMHEILRETSEDPEGWTQQDTCREIGYNQGSLSAALRVFKDFDVPAVAKASSMREAFNLLSRRDERAIADATADIFSLASSLQRGPGSSIASTAQEASTPSLPSSELPAELSILNEDFSKWVPHYEGELFNLIHCDFPYGVNLFGGEQSGKFRHETTYDDKPDVYWSLIETFCKHLDNFLAPSGHIIFWCSADIKIMAKTVSLFERLAPSLEWWGKPLIWHKTDNVGVLADPQRGPRHIYEVALVASREDRKIIKAVSDTYGAPTNKEFHPSTKPVPVLRQFFQMFVDSNTRMLDPTCGSGAALRAAESLGARHVLGLEIDPAHCNSARIALKRDRALASAVA